MARKGDSIMLIRHMIIELAISILGSLIASLILAALAR